MKRDSQNSDARSESSSDPDRTATEPNHDTDKDSYYYDDATGYELYREDEENENDEEGTQPD